MTSKRNPVNMESKRPHRSSFGKTKNRREGWQTDVEQPSDRVPLRSQERREPSVPLTAGASHSPTSAPSARREARGACRAVRGRGQAAGARASVAPDRGRGAGEMSWRRVSWGGRERYWPLLDGRLGGLFLTSCPYGMSRAWHVRLASRLGVQVSTRPPSTRT